MEWLARYFWTSVNYCEILLQTKNMELLLWKDCLHLATTVWNFTSPGIDAAPIPNDKEMSCMVTNVTVHTWQQKSDLMT